MEFISGKKSPAWRRSKAPAHVRMCADCGAKTLNHPYGIGQTDRHVNNNNEMDNFSHDAIGTGKFARWMWGLCAVFRWHVPVPVHVENAEQNFTIHSLLSLHYHCTHTHIVRQMEEENEKNVLIKMPFITSHDDRKSQQQLNTLYVLPIGFTATHTRTHMSHEASSLLHFNPYFNFLRRNYISRYYLDRRPFSDVVIESAPGRRAVVAVAVERYVCYLYGAKLIILNRFVSANSPSHRLVKTSPRVEYMIFALDAPVGLAVGIGSFRMIWSVCVF